MAAVYLAPHLLKDLTPELFTHNALGLLLTCNINQSPQTATELVGSSNLTEWITLVDLK